MAKELKAIATYEDCNNNLVDDVLQCLDGTAATAGVLDGDDGKHFYLSSFASHAYEPLQLVRWEDLCKVSAFIDASVSSVVAAGDTVEVVFYASELKNFDETPRVVSDYNVFDKEQLGDVASFGDVTPYEYQGKNAFKVDCTISPNTSVETRDVVVSFTYKDVTVTTTIVQDANIIDAVYKYRIDGFSNIEQYVPYNTSVELFPNTGGTYPSNEYRFYPVVYYSYCTGETQTASGGEVVWSDEWSSSVAVVANKSSLGTAEFGDCTPEYLVFSNAGNEEKDATFDVTFTIAENPEKKILIGATDTVTCTLRAKQAEASPVDSWTEYLFDEWEYPVVRYEVSGTYNGELNTNIEAVRGTANVLYHQRTATLWTDGSTRYTDETEAKSSTAPADTYATVVPAEVAKEGDASVILMSLVNPDSDIAVSVTCNSDIDFVNEYSEGGYTTTVHKKVVNGYTYTLYSPTYDATVVFKHGDDVLEEVVIPESSLVNGMYSVTYTMEVSEGEQYPEVTATISNGVGIGKFYDEPVVTVDPQSWEISASTTASVTVTASSQYTWYYWVGNDYTILVNSDNTAVIGNVIDTAYLRPEVINGQGDITVVSVTPHEDEISYVFELSGKPTQKNDIDLIFEATNDGGTGSATLLVAYDKRETVETTYHFLGWRNVSDKTKTVPYDTDQTFVIANDVDAESYGSNGVCFVYSALTITTYANGRTPVESKETELTSQDGVVISYAPDSIWILTPNTTKDEIVYTADASVTLSSSSPWMERFGDTYTGGTGYTVTLTQEGKPFEPYSYTVYTPYSNAIATFKNGSEVVASFATSEYDNEKTDGSPYYVTFSGEMENPWESLSVEISEGNTGNTYGTRSLTVNPDEWNMTFNNPLTGVELTTTIPYTSVTWVETALTVNLSDSVTAETASTEGNDTTFITTLLDVYPDTDTAEFANVENGAFNGTHTKYIFDLNSSDIYAGSGNIICIYDADSETNSAITYVSVSSESQPSVLYYKANGIGDNGNTFKQTYNYGDALVFPEMTDEQKRGFVKWVDNTGKEILESDYTNLTQSMVLYGIGDVLTWGDNTTEKKTITSTGVNALKNDYDAIYQSTSGKAHMPTSEQASELLENTIVEFVTVNEVNCAKLTSIDDDTKYIIIPLGGVYENGEVFGLGGRAYLWTSDLFEDYTCNVSILMVSSRDVRPILVDGVMNGAMNLRGVTDGAVEGIETVDFGLSSGTMWMTMNIGATAPEEYGEYFQWGATEGYVADEAAAHSLWSTAPFNNGASTFDEGYFLSNYFKWIGTPVPEDGSEFLLSVKSYIYRGLQTIPCEGNIIYLPSDTSLEEEIIGEFNGVNNANANEVTRLSDSKVNLDSANTQTFSFQYRCSQTELALDVEVVHEKCPVVTYTMTATVAAPNVPTAATINGVVVEIQTITYPMGKPADRVATLSMGKYYLDDENNIQAAPATVIGQFEPLSQVSSGISKNLQPTTHNLTPDEDSLTFNLTSFYLISGVVYIRPSVVIPVNKSVSSLPTSSNVYQPKDLYFTLPSGISGVSSSVTTPNHYITVKADDWSVEGDIIARTTDGDIFVGNCHVLPSHTDYYTLYAKGATSVESLNVTASGTITKELYDGGVKVVVAQIHPWGVGTPTTIGISGGLPSDETEYTFEVENKSWNLSQYHDTFNSNVTSIVSIKNYEWDASSFTINANSSATAQTNVSSVTENVSYSIVSVKPNDNNFRITSSICDNDSVTLNADYWVLDTPYTITLKQDNSNIEQTITTTTAVAQTYKYTCVARGAASEPQIRTDAHGETGQIGHVGNDYTVQHVLRCVEWKKLSSIEFYVSNGLPESQSTYEFNVEPESWSLINASPVSLPLTVTSVCHTSSYTWSNYGDVSVNAGGTGVTQVQKITSNTNPGYIIKSVTSNLGNTDKDKTPTTSGYTFKLDNDVITATIKSGQNEYQTGEGFIILEQNESGELDSIRVDGIDYANYNIRVTILNGSSSITNTSTSTTLTYNVMNTLLRKGFSTYRRNQVVDLWMSPNVSEITSGACSGCTNLTSVTQSTFGGDGSGIQSIGDYAFSGCSSLTGFGIDFSTMKTLGSGVFTNCSSVTAVNLVNFGDATSIGTKPFVNTSGALSISCSGTGKVIPVSMFEDSAFSSVTFNDELNISEIGNNAFKNNTHLTGFTIPDSVTALGETVFSGDTAMTDFTIGSGLHGVSYQNTHSGATHVENLTIRASSIAGDTFYDGYGYGMSGYAWSGMPYLSSVTFDDTYTATVIPLGAFSSCSSLDVLNFDSACVDRITGICSYAFDNTKLSDGIDVPANVVNIGWGAFRNTRTQGEIAIHNKIENISGEAFYGCSSASALTIAEPSSGKNLEIGVSAFENCSEIRNQLLTPSATTMIGERAFYYCSSAPSIHVQSYGSTRNNTTIGREAFGYCSAATALTLDEHIVEIQDHAFTHCERLPSFNLPATTETLGCNPWIYNYSLTGITVESGNSVYTDMLYQRPKANCIVNKKSVAEYTLNRDTESSSFSSERILNAPEQSIIYCGCGNSGLGTGSEDRYLDHIYYFADCAFRGNIVNDRRTFKIASEERQRQSILIGAHAFEDNPKLVEINNLISIYSTSYIGSHAFKNDVNLESISFHEDVQTIENEAFYNCGLQSITFQGTSLVDCVFGRGEVFCYNPIEIINGPSSDDDGKFWVSENSVYRHLSDEDLEFFPEMRDTSIPINTFLLCVLPSSNSVLEAFLPLVLIDKHAAHGNSAIKTLEISVFRYIGEQAFLACDNLTAATIFAFTIGTGAFERCSQLSNANVICPEIKDEAFAETNFQRSGSLGIEIDCGENDNIFDTVLKRDIFHGTAVSYANPIKLSIKGECSGLTFTRDSFYVNNFTTVEYPKIVIDMRYATYNGTSFTTDNWVSKAPNGFSEGTNISVICSSGQLNYVNGQQTT